MRTSILFFFQVLLIQPIIADTFHIGTNQTYTSIEQVAALVQPGDSILFHEGSHSGGQYVNLLQGAADHPIFIGSVAGELAIITGGNNAIQLSNAAYLHLKGLTFEQQTANGINVDDGGDYSSPSHHIIFESCIFQDMNANGNNDLLKLSGVDYFEVKNCTFLNGADGGSGIDMVGCHNGVIQGNYFENMGSNAIQAKGGTQHIRIERNFFLNGGQRTLNLGGNTGLAYFRPIDATFEAADLQVYSNVIIGSWAAIAFVGSINVEVVNNTIYRPENWVIRILQETVDPDRFVTCGDHTFQNNIVYLSNQLSTETNIGPNTRPNSFTFSHNLWYNEDNPVWSGPSIPVADASMIINENPMFLDPSNGDFLISINSPATGQGKAAEAPELDFYGMGFNEPRSIGAVEADPLAADFELPKQIAAFDLFPNPGSRQLTTTFILDQPAVVKLELIAQNGQRSVLLPATPFTTGTFEKSFDIQAPAGWYLIRMWADDQAKVESWLRVDSQP